MRLMDLMTKLCAVLKYMNILILLFYLKIGHYYDFRIEKRLWSKQTPLLDHKNL